MTSVEYPAAFVQKVNYVYLLQKSGYVTSNTPIYKVGHTKQELLDRFQQYERGAKLILQIECVDSVECERQILAEFKTTFAQATKDGNESFQGDYKQMMRIIYRIAMEQLDPDSKATNFDAKLSDTGAPYYVNLEECFNNYSVDAHVDVLREAERKCTNMLKDAYFTVINKLLTSEDHRSFIDEGPQNLAKLLISVIFPDFKHDESFGGNKNYFIILPPGIVVKKKKKHEYAIIGIHKEAYSNREHIVSDFIGRWSDLLSSNLTDIFGYLNDILFDIKTVGEEYKPTDVLLGGLLKLGVVYDINDVNLKNSILSHKKNVDIQLIDILVQNIRNYPIGEYAYSSYLNLSYYLGYQSSFIIILVDTLVNSKYYGRPDEDINDMKECNRFYINMNLGRSIEIVKIGEQLIPAGIIDYCFPTRVYCTDIEYVMYNRYQRPICEKSMKRDHFLPGAICHYLTDININKLDKKAFLQIKKKFVKHTKLLTCINPNPITDKLLTLFD